MEKVPEMEVEDVAFFCVAHVRLFETQKIKKNENLKFKFRHENRHKMKTGGWNVRNPSETTSVERFVLATKKVNGGTV